MSISMGGNWLVRAIVPAVAGMLTVVVPNAPVTGDSVIVPDVAFLKSTEPTEVPATPSVSLLTASVMIPATTFVSVVPAPSTTALAVSEPPVAVTVPEPAGVAQVPSPRRKFEELGVPVTVVIAVTDAISPPLAAGRVNAVAVPATANGLSVTSPDVFPNILIEPRVVVLTPRIS